MRRTLFAAKSEMQQIELNITTANENVRVRLAEKISIGRTNLADVALDDAGLSRVHARFERRANGEIWLFDENSTNGTFVNNEQIGFGGARVFDGDRILLGTAVRVSLKISRQAAHAENENRTRAKNQTNGEPSNQPESLNQTSENLSSQTKLLIAAGASSLAIVLVALAAIVIVNSAGNVGKSNKNRKETLPLSEEIPIAVVDPLKGDPEDIDDLLALFAETQEEDLKGEDIDDVKIDAKTDHAETNLNVTIGFWSEQKAKATAARAAPVGLDPPGTAIPPELFGDGVIKQKQKLAELIKNNYQQPMDFADLAQKRLAKELVELPMATADFYLEVGSSASDEPFSSFAFDTGNSLIALGTAKHKSLLDLAGVFASSLEDARQRKQMRIRLLRMFHPRAKPILEELAAAYRQKFDRPLRVTSLTRSMDYQIALNKVNPNSFKVRGAGSLPPHTSGCAFDLARKHMAADEQNFVMTKLAEMEKRGVLDALREGGANACFHVFIYPDGKPPK